MSVNEERSIRVLLVDDQVLFVQSLKVVLENLADDIEVVGIAFDGRHAVDLTEQTTFRDDDYVFRALRCGAAGYLLKTIPPPDLIEAIRAVNSQVMLMSPSVVDRLVALSSLHQGKGDELSLDLERVRSLYRSLSNREKDVLDLMAKAYDNREIAERLCIAAQTVKNHITAIYFKLGVEGRLDAMKSANQVPEIRGGLLNQQGEVDDLGRSL